MAARDNGPCGNNGGEERPWMGCAVVAGAGASLSGTPRKRIDCVAKYAHLQSPEWLSTRVIPDAPDVNAAPSPVAPSPGWLHPTPPASGGHAAAAANYPNGCGGGSGRHERSESVGRWRPPQRYASVEAVAAADCGIQARGHSVGGHPARMHGSPGGNSAVVG